MENYIIRPFNLKLFDTSVTISPIIVTIDINILNNFRAMTKLMAYHSDNIDNKLVYVSRPRYLETALENPRKYWKFAINNVINIIRRKKVNNNKIKKQYEMSKLVEMLILESIFGMNMIMVKQYYEERDRESRLSIFPGTDHEREFEDLEQLKAEIRTIKILLDIDKLAICQNQANRRFTKIKTDIESTKSKMARWVSWLPGFGRKYRQTEEEMKEPEDDMDTKFEEVIEKYSEIIEKKEKTKENDEIFQHFSITLPLFEIFLCNKKNPSFQPQVFCRLRMNEINFQRSSQNGRVDYLFAIDDIEVVNEEAKIKKFETIFRKKPKRSDLTEDESDEFLSRVNSDFDDEIESIEFDSNLGLFKNISKMNNLHSDPMQLLNSASSPPLILLNITSSKVLSNYENEEEKKESSSMMDFMNVEEYETTLKLYIQHFEIYVDKLMIGTTLNNFIRLQNDFLKTTQSQRRFNNHEDINVNTSISSLNLSPNKETSIKQMILSKKDEKSNKDNQLKSILVNVGGISIFIPNTEGFEKEFNVI